MLKREFEPKDEMRVLDIVRKAGGWNMKARRLTEQMADAITKPDKARRRSNAAWHHDFDEMSRMFRERFVELTRKRRR